MVSVGSQQQLCHTVFTDTLGGTEDVYAGCSSSDVNRTFIRECTDSIVISLQSRLIVVHRRVAILCVLPYLLLDSHDDDVNARACRITMNAYCTERHNVIRDTSPPTVQWRAYVTAHIRAIPLSYLNTVRWLLYRLLLLKGHGSLGDIHTHV